MLDQSYYTKTDEIIEHYGPKAASLIPIMQDIPLPAGRTSDLCCIQDWSDRGEGIQRRYFL